MGTVILTAQHTNAHKGWPSFCLDGVVLRKIRIASKMGTVLNPSPNLASGGVARGATHRRHAFDLKMDVQVVNLRALHAVVRPRAQLHPLPRDRHFVCRLNFRLATASSSHQRESLLVFFSPHKVLARGWTERGGLHAVPQ